MPHYQWVDWHAAGTEETRIIVSEIDDAGWETRVIQVFHNNTVEIADAESETERTGLDLHPMPDPDIIAADPEFSIVEIDRCVFMRLWRQAAEGQWAPDVH